jgi:AcrR family transcriptional regulator
MDGKANYHHGDLHNAFRRVSADLLAERGVAGYSLREASRRAGVSHTAATHHFGGVEGVLTAVAVEGLEVLVRETRAATDGVQDPVDAMAALGEAYVRVGVGNPGHAAVMFRVDVIDDEDLDWQRAAGDAHAILTAAVQRIADERNPGLDVPVAAAMCWATVQGLLTLEPVVTMKAAPMGAQPVPLGDLARDVARLLAEGLAAS